jgi:hypothetical protein
MLEGFSSLFNFSQSFNSYVNYLTKQIAIASLEELQLYNYNLFGQEINAKEAYLWIVD